MTFTNPMKDGLLGITFLLAAFLIYLGVEDYPQVAAVFPRLIAIGIFAVFGGLLIVRATFRWRLDTVPCQKAVDDPANMSVQFDARTLVMSAIICSAFFLVGSVGFIETMALLSIASCVVFKMKASHAATFVVVFCAILVGFLLLMGVRLPTGPASGFLFSLFN
ncbi:hypothetical protein [Puniceibacterium sp. IMCC21224]|uniref:hypothetical protein n=1 Tax=Puniceibacterium sp. IMCC21224 TaxID=1618204 RepID=UPI00065D5B01|nr:hypothetical protein [Puniceibacterium sp. IMCC21224]KMK65103.1 hypothetical protein IMCC21224_12348 [Puniceibacterium sp. IMCC21224]